MTKTETKNNDFAKNIIGDLEDIVNNDNHEAYLDGIDDLLARAKNLSTNKSVNGKIQKLLDKNSNDTNDYQKAITKLDKMVYPGDEDY